MSSAMVDKIARAVLYEGYLLYPYRKSALKNRQRWNFGVLYPPAWAARQTGSDRSYFQMECLARCGGKALVDVSLRFLHLATHAPKERRNRTGSVSDPASRVWQETTEQSVSADSLSFAVLPHLRNFSFPGAEDTDQRKLPIHGEIEISAAQVQNHVFRLTVRVRNTTDCQTEIRDEALLHSLASAHAVLHVRDGQFISQIDPPEELRDAIDACQNVGVWPVLVGDGGNRDTMLGSPIILYDYPQVAPESQGDLFDATEIDEILSLRILTLTDQEKEEARRSDERARQILENLEANPEHLLQLHGTVRAISRLKKGDRVRLRPRKRADIFDTLLEG
ncbi:MAG: hypothetical protein ACRD3Y_09890, partial [Bryobacteraceae bacterium]